MAGAGTGADNDACVVTEVRGAGNRRGMGDYSRAMQLRGEGAGRKLSGITGGGGGLASWRYLSVVCLRPSLMLPCDRNRLRALVWRIFVLGSFFLVLYWQQRCMRVHTHRKERQIDKRESPRGPRHHVHPFTSIPYGFSCSSSHRRTPAPHASCWASPPSPSPSSPPPPRQSPPSPSPRRRPPSRWQPARPQAP